MPINPSGPMSQRLLVRKSVAHAAIAITNPSVSPTYEESAPFAEFTAGAPTVALSAVISGSAQFSIHGPEWTAIAASKGAPVDIIANVVNGAAVWIATAPDFKFDSIKDI